MLPKREVTSDGFEVVSTPVSRGATAAGVVADVAVAPVDGVAAPAAIALASMTRARRSEQEDVWVQVYVDGQFVDVGRATDIDTGIDTNDVTFVARFTMPASCLDGATHRVRVCFVSAVSRVVPRGEGKLGQSDLTPQAIAEADFVWRPVSNSRIPISG